MSTPRLDAIGIVARDLSAAVRFYRLVGLDFPDPKEGEGHLEALSGGLRVMLDSVDVIKSFNPGWTEPTGHRMNLAFHCGDAAGVDAAYARITEAGFAGAKAPWDAFWGQRYGQVVDADGNVVDLFAPLG